MGSPSATWFSPSDPALARVLDLGRVELEGDLLDRELPGVRVQARAGVAGRPRAGERPGLDRLVLGVAEVHRDDLLLHLRPAGALVVQALLDPLPERALLVDAPGEVERAPVVVDHDRGLGRGRLVADVVDARVRERQRRQLATHEQAVGLAAAHVEPPVFDGKQFLLFTCGHSILCFRQSRLEGERYSETSPPPPSPPVNWLRRKMTN